MQPIQFANRANRTGSHYRNLEHFSSLLHLIYDAGLHPERWNQAVAAIAASLGCNKGVLFSPFASPQSGGLIFPAGFSEASVQLWATKYIKHDVWAQRTHALNLWQQGNVILDQDLMPTEELLESKFYREFLCLDDIARVCVATVFENGPATVAIAISVYRGLQDPPFTNEDREWMRLLASHVSRSLGVMQRLDILGLQHATLLTSLDRLPFGVVLLDSSLRMLHLNQSAQKVIQRKDGLHIANDGFLESSNPVKAKSTRRVKAVAVALKTERASLHDWLTSLKDGSQLQPSHFQDGYEILREGRQQYLVQCSPIVPDSGWGINNKSVHYVMFIHDPAALRLPKAATLMKVYGLSRIHADVALAFANGATYREAARRLNRSEETIRSHVKEIYPRLGVSRQADLVRLILSLATNSV